MITIKLINNPLFLFGKLFPFRSAPADQNGPITHSSFPHQFPGRQFTYRGRPRPTPTEQSLVWHDKEIYQSMQTLTDYTKRMALEHNFKMVEKCLELVERIYDKGTALVKNAVENIFIFSFSSMRMLCNIVEWRMVQSYMPAGLYTLYIQQVLRSKDG